jgi:hypothetical protein
MLASPSRRYQMRRVTIAVIGNGKTSRANVEALLNDTIESFDETYVALIYDKTPSEGGTGDWITIVKGISLVQLQTPMSETVGQRQRSLALQSVWMQTFNCVDTHK